MIDAHCGAIGLLGANDHPIIEAIPFHQKIALIGGTRFFVFYACLFARSFKLNEWRQYTQIDQAPIQALSEKAHVSVYAFLNHRLQEIAKAQGLTTVSFLTKDIHVNPYFHGNRSPLCNPHLKGIISGMKLQDLDNIDRCALYYLALCYDSLSILDTIKSRQIEIKAAFCTGGLSKNDLFVRLHADITQIPVVLPKVSDSVLVGGAVLAMVAHRTQTANITIPLAFQTAMKAMNHASTVVEPSADEKLIRFHQCKYKVFRKMIDDFNLYDTIMSDCV
ncbi:hypothetical protein RFI_21671 [Reticulomyxa filosa]|uniref:Carbohydrate kinase FGGY C-terminal domain-containing protein n=1 Tax=Reticulomyxa filosa TaxID=46433 RepID=X6MNW6_RETFI|nr:hypothetical protein RFI_21671 [Reticulomyxa filosa]|eukprot:ETO15693.1 hypothetical protein RFI_21671 [Reticulomyxa filosa]